jgi:acyl-CoA thioesterase-2
MSELVNVIIDLLNLETIEDNIYRGENRDLGGKAVFGGQVLAQALVAAQRTVEPDRLCHSMHGYFLLAGDKKVPIVYDVDRIRDGKSFTTRRVRAIQHGKVIFNMAASFAVEEEGLEHQIGMPDVPPPESLTSELENRRKLADHIPEPLRSKFLQDQPIEFRPVDPMNPLAPEKKPPYKYVWFKAVSQLPDDDALHKAVLAYASDFAFVGTGMQVHGLSFWMRNLQVASLDHALWFHRRFRADDWLLYAMDSPTTGHARGFNRGSIYTRDGVLIASVAQEGLMRLRLDE